MTEVALKINRGNIIELEHMNEKFVGHVWTLTLSYVSGPNNDSFMAN